MKLRALPFALALAACSGAPEASPTPDVPDAAEDAKADDAAEDAAIDAAEDAAAPDAPDAVAPVSELYVHRVETPAQLIGGPGAYGAVGKAWVIGNAQARFLVQDVDAAVGVVLQGGNLIDAELVGDGVTPPSGDLFRETFPIVDWRVLVPEAVEVLADGADGQEAILRVRGQLGTSGILDILDVFAGSHPLEATMDYVVRPGAPEVVLRTTVTNAGETGTSFMAGDFLAFGKMLTLFTPETGFVSGSSIGTVSAIAGRGDGVSYAYARGDGGTVDAPIVDASGTAAILSMDTWLEPGEAAVFERVLVVGDSIGAVLGRAFERADVATGEVSGTVTLPSGAPGADLYVTALPVPAGGGDPDHAHTQALTDAEGRFTLRARTGAYQLVASGRGHARSEAVPVTVAADAPATAALEVGAVAEVTLALTGDGPTPTGDGTFPVKVSLSGLDVPEPDPRLGERSISGQTHVAFLGAGDDVLRVPPGHYDVVLSHGPEHERLELSDVLLTDGQVLTGHLARAVETAGWLGCDFHQHTTGSLDANAPLPAKLRENLAGGLDCAAITDHDNVVDIRPVVDALGAGPAFHGIVGNELSISGVGHFNTFPLPTDLEDPHALLGSKLWAGKTVPEVFADVRALPGERAILINHPRDNGIKGYFTTLGFDAWGGEGNKGVLALDFDGVEVNASLGSASQFTPEGWAGWAGKPSTSVPVLADWFGFLNRGLPVCGIGNSDSHDVGDNAGYPRTYLRVPDDAPGAVTDDQIVSAIHKQHAIVARGAFVEVTANGQTRMGHTELVDGSAGPVALRVVARVPSWLSLTTVELYANGLHVETRAATAPAEGSNVWFDDTFAVSPEVDAWYVVLVRGPTQGGPVFSGATYAFTNPIYVDVDGDGFTAPGPVALP